MMQNEPILGHMGDLSLQPTWMNNIDVKSKYHAKLDKHDQKSSFMNQLMALMV
jgi:hypothetical protein